MPISPLKSKVFEIVNRIPKGKVAYYGQIAAVFNEESAQRLTAQVIGWTLSGMTLPEYSLCPWQRVVAKNGYIAALKLGPKGLLQKEILHSEKVEIINDFVDMGKFCVGLEELILHT